MTSNDVKFLHDKLKEISETLDVSVSLFVFSETECHAVIYGCPACTVNVMRDWISEHVNDRHTDKHKNMNNSQLN